MIFYLKVTNLDIVQFLCTFKRKLFIPIYTLNLLETIPKTTGYSIHIDVYFACIISKFLDMSKFMKPYNLYKNNQHVCYHSNSYFKSSMCAITTTITSAATCALS